MKRIMVLNSKGGSGKSTIASNLAGYYANWGMKVALADFDPQRSSLDWLRARSQEYPRIYGISASNDTVAIPPDIDLLVMDTPASVQKEKLEAYIHQADVIIIPVLPSPMDIRAAAKFIHELLLVYRVSRENTKVCVVANRVRIRTLAYRALERFVKALKIPFVTTLRESRNYLHATESGQCIFEIPGRRTERDVEQWQPLIKWLHIDDSNEETETSNEN